MSHTPLFSPGFHDVSEADLDNHFLGAFSTSSTRPALLAGLRSFLACLKKVGIEFEVWLDGSFCTEKPDPSDVDLVIFAESHKLNSLDIAMQQYLNILFDRTNSKAVFGCDVLFCVSDDINRRSYWRGWYGYDRAEKPKGIAKLVIAP